MAEFPFSKKDRAQGEALIDKGAIQSVLFSERSYQVEVVDDQVYWPFLQIDDYGSLLDCFCTCEYAEQEHSCPQSCREFP